MSRTKGNAFFGAVMCALLGGAIVGCAVGAPPGFSAGERWTLPLVGPMENGLLLVPVTVGGSGPYLFIADPDAPVTVLDPAIVSVAKLGLANGGRMLDESDVHRPMQIAVARALTIGSLTVGRTEMLVAPSRFVAQGRAVVGRLGRDVLRDTVSMDLDRDRGVVELATQGQFVPDAAFTKLGYEKLVYRRETWIPPVTRRLVTATIDGKRSTLHLDLGDVPSQLRRGHWASRGLVPMPREQQFLDEANSLRTVKEQTVANQVVLGTAVASAHPLIPFGDKRWEETDIDGTLGLAFFAPYRVVANWHTATVWLAARAPDASSAAARIARWPSLQACAESGCADVSITAATPFSLLTIRRAEASAPLDLLLDVAGRAVSVSLPAGTSEFVWQVPPAVVTPGQGATARVVDASPYPRVCTLEGPCALLL